MANGFCFQSAIHGAPSRCAGRAHETHFLRRLGSRLKTALSSASACSPQHQEPLERSSPRPASSMRMAVLEGRAPNRKVLVTPLSMPCSCDGPYRDDVSQDGGGVLPQGPGSQVVTIEVSDSFRYALGRPSARHARRTRVRACIARSVDPLVYLIPNLVHTPPLSEPSSADGLEGAIH